VFSYNWGRRSIGEVQPYLIPDRTVRGQVSHRAAKQATLQEHNIVQPKKNGTDI
jgi:hypothetical protein